MPKDNWLKLNADTDLSPKAKALHAAVRKTFEATKLAKDAFETQLRADAGALPKGKRLAVSFKYGLSIAVVDDDGAATVKPSTLADYLKAAAAQGVSA